MEEYYWELVEETSKKSNARFPYEEKCSAAGLGLAYALDTYSIAMGRQYPYFIECMNSAIEAARKRSNEYRRIESEFSLDKPFYDEKGNVSTGRDFIPMRAMSVEQRVLWKEFYNDLTKEEQEILEDALISNPHFTTRQQVILDDIRNKYIYYCM